MRQPAEPTDPAADSTRFAATLIVVANDGEAADAANEAAALAGARVIDRVDYRDARARLAAQVALDIVLVEAGGAAPAMLDHLLADVGTAARALGARIVVTFGRAQLEQVAAQLDSADVQLLCEPSIVDRVGAIALAARPDVARLNDSLREAESDRLRRLNEDVARIADALARLTHGDRDAGADRGVRDRSFAYHAPPDVTIEGADDPIGVDAAAIRAVIRARRMRAQFFVADLFADPAWDMLLDLFAARLEHVGVSVSSLCIAAAVPPTTALRWISTMTQAGLLERRDDPHDRRRAFIALTPKAYDGMRNYAQAIRAAGLTMV